MEFQGEIDKEAISAGDSDALRLLSLQSSGFGGARVEASTNGRQTKPFCDDISDMFILASCPVFS